MVAKTALKICVAVAATCAGTLGVVLIGEIVVRSLRPVVEGPRLKLEIIATAAAGRRPVDFKPMVSAVDREPAGAGSLPLPRPEPTAAVAPPASRLPASGPFDAIAGQDKPDAAPPSSSLAYAEPPAPSDSLATPPASPRDRTPTGSIDKADVGAASSTMLTDGVPPDQAAPAVAAIKPDLAPDNGSGSARLSRRATFKASLDDPASDGQPGQSLRILQIGDSHTAADMFTGDVRQRLQSIYGDGGAGYLVVGTPHPGVRSDLLKMSASPGWAYTAIQRSEDASQFHLSGFNAIAAKPGETLTLKTDAPISFDAIDIEVMHGPNSGGVELRFDNDQAVKFDLAGDKPEWWFLRATSQRHRTEHLRQLSITTLDQRPVDVSSVAIFNQADGVSYSAIGFPGATIDIVNKFPDDFFAADLQRIDPQIVVLAFGTNEGFNDALDIPKYGERYEEAVRRIKGALPNAAIVVVAPPNANRLPHGCKAEGAHAVCHGGNPEPAAACAWQTPPKLDRVREMQKLIAAQDHLYYWNWADVMPAECGAHLWATATPRLMQPDHVHFTAEGYRLGAAKFSEFLMGIIEKLRLTDRVVSNN